MNANELAEQFRSIANNLRFQVNRHVEADRLRPWIRQQLDMFHKLFFANAQKFGYTSPEDKPASSVGAVCNRLGWERMRLLPDVRYRIDFEGGNQFSQNEAERITHYEAYSLWLADLLDKFSESIESTAGLGSYGRPNGPILNWKKVDTPLAGLRIVIREPEQLVTPKPKPDAKIIEKWNKYSPAEKRVLELYSESLGKAKPARINKQIRIEFEGKKQIPMRWTTKTKRKEWDDKNSAMLTIKAAVANGVLVKLPMGGLQLSPEIQSELQPDSAEVLSKNVI